VQPCAIRELDLEPVAFGVDAIGEQLNEIDRRIAGLLTLRDALKQLQTEGAVLPLDDVRGERCICYLLKTYRDTGQITIQKGKFFDD